MATTHLKTEAEPALETCVSDIPRLGYCPSQYWYNDTHISTKTLSVTEYQQNYIYLMKRFFITSSYFVTGHAGNCSRTIYSSHHNFLSSEVIFFPSLCWKKCIYCSVNLITCRYIYIVLQGTSMIFNLEHNSAETCMWTEYLKYAETMFFYWVMGTAANYRSLLACFFSCRQTRHVPNAALNNLLLLQNPNPLCVFSGLYAYQGRPQNPNFEFSL